MRQPAEYFVCVPVSPADTGAENTGPGYVRDATVLAAHEQLDGIFKAMRAIGLTVDGELGDYRPLRALDAAVRRFQLDQFVIAEARSLWLRLGLVDKVRSAYPIPVTHMVSRQSKPELLGGRVRKAKLAIGFQHPLGDYNVGDRVGIVA